MSEQSVALRLELSRRAITYAKAEDLPYYLSLGLNPVVLFPQCEERHGNFVEASYRAIQGDRNAYPRLAKMHPQRRRALPEDVWATARELDSCNSSDALLMNVFCFPGVATRELCDLLLLKEWDTPRFGLRCCLPGEDPRRPTELDMAVMDLCVEAKLTEEHFTWKPEPEVLKYETLVAVFEVSALPRRGAGFDSYQLIRNVLAAHQRNARFTLIYDRRRPDLLSRWDAIHRAIRLPDIATRCTAVDWQTIAALVPHELRSFLDRKYGIIA